MPIHLPNGGFVPLQELAELQLTSGTNQINRENDKRRMVVTTNVRGRDLGSFVADVRRVVRDNVAIPPGYWVEYGGTYQKLQSATERLSVVVPVTLLMIIGLLILALSSVKDAMIIFSSVPLALTGGVAACCCATFPSPSPPPLALLPCRVWLFLTAWSWCRLFGNCASLARSGARGL